MGTLVQQRLTDCLRLIKSSELTELFRLLKPDEALLKRVGGPRLFGTRQ